MNIECLRPNLPIQQLNNALGSESQDQLQGPIDDLKKSLNSVAKGPPDNWSPPGDEDFVGLIKSIERITKSYRDLDPKKRTDFAKKWLDKGKDVREKLTTLRKAWEEVDKALREQPPEIAVALELPLVGPEGHEDAEPRVTILAITENLVAP